MEKKCPQCFKLFETDGKGRYCSRTCLSVCTDVPFPSKTIKIKCQACGRICYSNAKNKIFCSLECHYRKPLEICRHCGKDVPKDVKGEFCSFDCRQTSAKAFRSRNDKRYQNKDFKKEFVNRKERRSASLTDYIWKNEYKRLYEDFFINRIIRGKGTHQN